MSVCALAIKTALHAGNRNRKAVIVIVFAYNEMLVRRGTAYNTTTTTYNTTIVQLAKNSTNSLYILRVQQSEVVWIKVLP